MCAAEMRDLVAVQVAQAEKRMRSDGFWLRCIAEVEKAPEVVSTRELRPSRAPLMRDAPQPRCVVAGGFGCSKWSGVTRPPASNRAPWLRSP